MFFGLGFFFSLGFFVCFCLVQAFSSLLKKSYLSWKVEVEKQDKFWYFCQQHTIGVHHYNSVPALQQHVVTTLHVLHSKEQGRKNRLQCSDLCT